MEYSQRRSGLDDEQFDQPAQPICLGEEIRRGRAVAGDLGRLRGRKRVESERGVSYGEPV